ncbi:CASP C terminal-domain-containing protein [Epithele typhae]|uniref:CASP C terminal-domain-containing protein n=1 Tax=Epithele typhae TaxID=378194 RepID=UPI002008A2B4|nr:CASP C terminal-domain-containing protein [Epithele typhae]KAH9929496.1 CASP C terminal-domain-containing protein [Epithele typhae]
MAAPEQNFSGALATWKDINLSELQKTLDAQGIELVENQKESVVGRKALADRTKEFKKMSDEEKLTAYKGLLKAYQTEIDSLTKRSKTAENAFLNVYKVLAEAPDPYPLLEAAVDQTVKVAEARELEAELQRAREENAELRKRLNENTSLENAKKKADSRVEQLEQKMDDLIQEKVNQKENELNATYDEKMRNYEEREQDLQRQLALTKNQLRDLRMSHDSNQAKLLDHTQRQDHETVAKLAELDMMVADLEHANSRVATVERRNELLRAEIEAMKSGHEGTAQIKEYESKIADLESETDRLSQALEVQKTATGTAQAAATRKSAEVDQLKTKLKQFADYDEIKRELDIMKYVEFAGLEGDDDVDDITLNGDALGLHLPSPNPNSTSMRAQQGKSLEVLLATKNKRILEELTRFRVLHGELETALQSVQSQLDATESELERQRTLNEKLETDLLHMDQRKGDSGINGGVAPANGSSTSDVLADLDLGRKNVGYAAASDSLTRSTPIPFAPSADTSILPIVTSQRDRFRQRNAELEEELRKQFNIISELRAEVKSLQADNLKLYEKVRYMQSYREDVSTRPSTLDPIPSNVAGRSDDMSKYRARYEEAMNPFQAFRGREATRAYESLNVLERGALVLTRAILGNRRTRTAFILYAIALHLLVVFTLYECSSSSSSKLERKPSPYGG